MPVFVYRAVTDKGKIVRNKVDEVSRKSLIKKLRRNNLVPINIVQVRSKVVINTPKAKKHKTSKKNINEILHSANIYNVKKDKEKKAGIKFRSKIKVRDLVIFTQDFYLLKKANFNNIHAISTIIENTENDELREILRDILAGLEAGENIYTTMEYYDQVFPYLYINMIKVGELSGELTRSLEQAIAYLDENEKFTKKLRGIIVPNSIMLASIILMLIVGVVFIVPVIQDLYTSMGSDAEVPAITLWFYDFTKLLAKYWFIPVLAIALVIAMIIQYIQTPKGKYNFDYYKYTMPLFGKLIFSLDFLRFTKAMLLNLSNGIRIQDALETSKSVIKNIVLGSIIEASINNIILGKSWIEPFEKSNLASPMMIEMLNIGMKTDLIEMMGKLIEYIQTDIDNTLDKIMKVLPEIVYGIVGIALIILVVVVLVPAIQVYMGGWLFSAAGV